AMILFGERIDGRTAERVGFAWRCFPDDELLEGARALAKRAAAASAVAPRLLAQVKESIGEAHTLSTHEEAVDHELVKQLISMEEPASADRLGALRDSIRNQR